MTDHSIREAVYTCIVDYIAANQYAPTIGEIAGCVSRSGTAVRWHLDKLEQEGRISRIPGRAGGIIINQ